MSLPDGAAASLALMSILELTSAACYGFATVFSKSPKSPGPITVTTEVKVTFSEPELGATQVQSGTDVLDPRYNGYSVAINDQDVTDHGERESTPILRGPRGSLSAAAKLKLVKEQLRASAKSFNKIFTKSPGVFRDKTNRRIHAITSSYHNADLANGNRGSSSALSRSWSSTDLPVRALVGNFGSSECLLRSRSFTRLEVREQEELSLHYPSTDEEEEIEEEEFEEPVAKRKDLKKYLGPLDNQEPVSGYSPLGH